MMDNATIQKYGKRLHSRMPLLGAWRRRTACRRLAAEPGWPAAPYLIEAVESGEPELVSIAETALRQVREAAAVEMLCKAAIKNPAGRTAAICKSESLRPADPEEMCLFLVVTGQLDAYAKEDSEFQYLRPAFERADPDVKARVMAIYRSGDRRLDGFIGTGDERIAGSKKLENCTDEEIRHFIDSRLRHNEWPKLFSAFVRMPLRLGLPLLPRFRNSGWAPEDPELRSVLSGALAELGQESPAAAHTSAVFERWLKEGSASAASRTAEQQILETLRHAAPPDGVRAVGALAALPRLSDGARKAVRDTAHWLVRLAGVVTGVAPLELTAGPSENYWLRTLAYSKAIMDFWPSKATPADLDALAAAPPEAWIGQLGQARRILRLLIANRVGTDTVVEDFEVDIDIEGAIVERAE
jgi:hypothetical protein